MSENLNPIEEATMILNNELVENEELSITNEERNETPFTVIRKKDGSSFVVRFINPSITVAASEVLLNGNYIAAQFNDIVVSDKVLADDEVLFVETFQQNELIVVRNTRPLFRHELGANDKYPKFELNVSDCMYGIKIYLDGDTYINIPACQSHYSMVSTLEYLTNMVKYLTETRSEFIHQLCSSNRMSINIMVENEFTGEKVINYLLTEKGICLNSDDGELKDYEVQWNSFFKLVMDGKWVVEILEPVIEEAAETVSETEEVIEIAGPAEIEECAEEHECDCDGSCGSKCKCIPEDELASTPTDEPPVDIIEE